ncbi:hypothetical protein HC928_23665 [bacterium]|nr:hypothetical protein [bacterium]
MTARYGSRKIAELLGGRDHTGRVLQYIPNIAHRQVEHPVKRKRRNRQEEQDKGDFRTRPSASSTSSRLIVCAAERRLRISAPSLAFISRTPCSSLGSIGYFSSTINQRK